MLQLILRIFLVPAIALVTTAASAQEIAQQDLADMLKVKIRTVQHMALNPMLVTAVRDQNQQSLGIGEIKKRDEEWKSTDQLTDRKRRLMSSDAARLLRDTVGDGNTFTEAFLTDDQGANVAVYPPTSDYWQGDEEKWTASWANGTGQIYIGPLEHDESTNKYAVQISAPVKDGPDTIGVLVVGVSVDYLSDRSN